MGKFCQISTELLPLNFVKNGFNALSWAFLADCLKLCTRVDIWEKWFGIVDG